MSEPAPTTQPHAAARVVLTLLGLAGIGMFCFLTYQQSHKGHLNSTGNIVLAISGVVGFGSIGLALYLARKAR
jgi:hypothetical protein